MANKDGLLPPRPGEESEKDVQKIKGVPISIYINGNVISMSRQEALGVMSQICNIFCYLDNLEQEKIERK